MANETGDRAFTEPSIMGSTPEMVFAGATSFARRKYTRDLTDAEVVISGVPWDCSTTYRPGTRLGPRAIRAASANLCFGKVWPWNIDPFDHLGVIDWGDIAFNEGYRDTMSANVEAYARQVVAGGRKTLTIGGDHYIALPMLRAIAAHYGPVALVHFDAHSDTWEDDYEHHGTMFLTAIEEGLIDVERSVQVGLRTFNESDSGITVFTAPWVHDNGPDAVASVIKERVGEGAAYLSFDIDCLDPVFAPGTGTPVCGGLSMYQAQSILYRLGGIDFVGMDIVEVSPPFDHAEVTALAAATLGLDWLCLLAANKLGMATPNPYQGGSGVVTVKT